MRFFLLAAVAAVAFVSSSNAAGAETLHAVNSARGVNDDGTGFARSLRSYTSDDAEERAIGEVLAVENRALASVKYRSWYKAKVTPTQVKTVLGVTQKELNKTAKELQQLYLGYYSYYTAMKRREAKKKKLKSQVKM
ncbi:hypothetical protein PHYPSEUDO_007826 [Phytophthora pseudosyringae]|uniref:RxLR effector protein n=1 Tax=Phytophthora pseudosyringae TaxID=221518 RepID=A0A8T1VIL4_9STRA|nr:hypothetical protein PHYPSEUDO_007826 [Phytophthora pseudosyringae]